VSVRVSVRVRAHTMKDHAETQQTGNDRLSCCIDPNAATKEQKCAHPAAAKPKSG
jgi:hypothetical protein